MHFNTVKERNTEMDVKEPSLEEVEHEHAVVLLDMQLMHRNYEEDDDDYEESDLITTQNFKCLCNRCGRPIDWYHRYYYKCSISSCYYTLHKFCKEMPTTLKFQGHPSHTLVLKRKTNDEKCRACHSFYRGDDVCYRCSTCDYGIDLLCATFVEQNTIHYPGHPHPLISVTIEPVLSKCFACGKKHEGQFYHCTTCFNFSINSECLSLPMKLLLDTQQFSHRHLLTLSYSFLDQSYDFECRICGMKFDNEHLVYKCSKCMYYVHPDCATQRIEPFTSIFLPGLGKTEKNFKDADHPNLVHLPFSDESPILSHGMEGEAWLHERDEKGYLKHIFHDHPLVLIHNDTTTSLHDPITRIKLLCNGCARPVTKMPFYKCSTHSDGCDFVLHDWCSRLPKKLKNYVGHPQHTLELFSLGGIVGITCRICGLIGNGFFYLCSEKGCLYVIDVNCASIPEEITHEAHANHLLTRVDASSSLSKIECRACRVSIDKSEIYYRCSVCDFYMDCRCALHLPKTIRHKCDKHPLQLSYYPIEEHRSQYFCEVCEAELDPGKWFYHCVECAQSIHSACAPLILQSEQGINSLFLEGVYKFINIKFPGVKKQPFHQHPVLIAPGTDNDGLCQKCGSKLQSHLFWKCLHCNINCHYQKCLYYESKRTPGGIAIRRVSRFGENKHLIKSRPQKNLEFFPSEMMRPVTSHWKVVDDIHY